MSTPDPAADDPFASSPTPPPAPAPAPVRKSLFKNRAARTGAAAAAAAAQKKKEEEEGRAAIGFFSRAKEVFAENMEGERRERERERARREKRGRESGSREIEGGSGGEEGGRRKRSRSEHRSSTPKTEDMATSSRSIERDESTQSTKLNGTASPVSTQETTQDTAPIISLSSDEEDTNYVDDPYPSYPSAFSSPPKPPNTNHPNIPIPIAIPSDDEAKADEEEELYPDLIAAARLAAPSRTLTHLAPTSTTSTSTPAADPILTLLITSPLPHTTPLLIRRRLSQRLKDVRLAWCAHQLIDSRPLTPAETAGVFLTWKGRRVWDVTTCASMGVTVGRQGVLDADEGGGGDVHLEAWTREAFEEFQARERSRGGVKGGDRDRGGDHDHDDASDDASAQPAPEPETKLRVVLRAKGVEEVKLLVKPTTKVTALIAAFKAQRSAETEGKGVELWFDGEKLGEEEVVADADLEDLSGVDVVLR